MCNENLDVGRDGVAFCATDCEGPGRVPAVEEMINHLLQSVSC